jgi:hypothetical protein
LVQWCWHAALSRSTLHLTNIHISSFGRVSKPMKYCETVQHITASCYHGCVPPIRAGRALSSLKWYRFIGHKQNSSLFMSVSTHFMPGRGFAKFTACYC